MKLPRNTHCSVLMQEEKSKDKKQERHSVLSELGNKQKECSGFEKKPGRTPKKTEMEI